MINLKALMEKRAEQQQIMENLPYKLTRAQLNAWHEIERDLCGHTLMSRLVQGDVGSGKTILAFLAMILTVENGYQAALMVPTEVLANQHFEAFTKLIEEQESRIKEITEIYGKYVVNYESFAKLSPYILPGSYAYSYLSRISRTNIWLEVSRKPAFSDMKVYNYQSYTKDCFSCEVSFDLQVSYNSGSFKDYPTHMEYIFVKRSGKWYIADMVMLK